MAFNVRQGRVEDVEAIVEIWKAGLASSIGVAPELRFDPTDYFRQRLEAQNDKFKYFVVETETGEIAAWQCLSPFRANPLVRDTMAEISAYASPAHRATRATFVGLQELFRHADESPLAFLVAFISDLNRPAIRLAEHFGMKLGQMLEVSPKSPDLPALQLLVYRCGDGHATPTATGATDATDPA